MRGITKRFPGVVALSNVSLHVRGGEVLSLMGENGAGKSTLMKILSGAYEPNEGELLIDGQPIVFKGVADAKKHGIALIHQELMLAGNLDISGNIFLGNERRSLGGLGPMRRASMKKTSQELLDRVGLKLSASTPVSSLTAGQMQMVEIAKSLAFNARAIIMDEPTSSLTAGESAHLFKIIAQLKSEGIAIIYISHRMEEVLHLSDRITVMRDGKYIGDLARADATHDKIVSMMVGRELTTRFPDRLPIVPKPDEQPVLAVENLVVPGAPEGVSFTALRGEIVGFAGLVGAGRTELMQVLFGVDPANGGSMKLNGKAYDPRNVRSAISQGIYLAPEDRKRHGLVLPMSIAQNTSLPDIQNYPPKGWLNRRRKGRGEAGSRANAHQGPHRRDENCESVGRKSAEGRPRQMVGHETFGTDPRRADARNRRGRQGRDLPHNGYPGQSRHHHSYGQLRNGRSARNERSHGGHARTQNSRHSFTIRIRPGTHRTIDDRPRPP